MRDPARRRQAGELLPVADQMRLVEVAQLQATVRDVVGLCDEPVVGLLVPGVGGGPCPGPGRVGGERGLCCLPDRRVEVTPCPVRLDGGRPRWIDRGDIIQYEDQTLQKSIAAFGIVSKFGETPQKSMAGCTYDWSGHGRNPDEDIGIQT